jgi:hypothetical protein
MKKLCALCTLLLLVPLQATAQQNASFAQFVGTWVGVQTWTTDVSSPSARDPQLVTLTIQLINGKLAGTMTPFFGGKDEAVFVNAEIEGEQLRATARIAKPDEAKGTSAESTPSAASTTARKSWTDPVQVTFLLKADRENLTGTADILMGAVKWLKFSYELGKKRSRY